MIDVEFTRAFREANYHQLQDYMRTLLREGDAARRKLAEELTWESQQQLRSRLLDQIGYPPPVAEEPDYRQQEETLLLEEDGLSFYRLLIHVAQGLDCYGILIRPSTPGPHRLCMLLHGAVGCPEMITGLHMTANYYDAGKKLAKRGFLVFAPLTLFRPYVDGELSNIPGDAREVLDRGLRAADTTLIAVELYKIRRSTDVLLARSDVIPGSAAIAGLSFGGFYTLLTAAADTRFDTIYSSCFFTDQMALYERGIDRGLGEFVWPGSNWGCSSLELALLCLPRRLILENGIGDASFPIDNARRAAQRVREVAQRLGCEENLHFVEFNGQHEFGLSEALDYFV